MKRSKSNQATLFQSWGHWQPSSSCSAGHGAKNQTNGETFHIFDLDEIVTLGDEEDDDELLAAAAEIVPFDEANANFTGHGENSTSMPNLVSKSSLDIEVIPGFDSEAGNVWIYPTNYPIRNYQYDIVGQALFKNTLVTLPTGLGKTFIAAVVMYNFYRWYPQGKVIFMAPTKPLVAQQIEACYNIMGIPQSDTAEMTGNMAPSKRQSLWQSHRVLFLTPQVLQNDLSRGSCVAEQVVLLVVDEAHKALGNHAYCQVVREVSGYTRNFRVLALSATPGDDLQAVQQVITNLLISHMELRTEDSPDIKPYTHSRLVEKVVVSLGDDIGKVKRAYLRVLEGVVGRLFCKRALWQRDPQRVTKFQVLSARDTFRKKLNEQGGMDRTQAGFIEGDFAMCISLYHAYELLLQHGILSFYNFIKGIMDGTKGMSRAKSEITKNQEFTQIMDELRQEIEPPVEDSANSSALFSQFSPRRRALMNAPKPSSSFKSHPKLIKLKKIVLEHFEKYQDEASARANVVATRVMIFSQYRDSVNEIAAMLSQHKPAVRVMSFIGQQSTGKSSRGLTQKEQLEVVQRFRQGGYNTLVATCVGEEGLDIGEVDLIICFDAHASPIRLVQRMGRTGRKRDGRIVILVTEGKEEQIYKKSQSKKKSIHKAVTQAAKSFDLYSHNPRMVPRHLTPQVLKMEMTVGKFVGHSKGKRKGRSSDGAKIKAFITKSGTSKKADGLLTYEELVYWQENFKLPGHEAGFSSELHVKKNSRRSLVKPTVMSLTEWLPWQTQLQPVKFVKHSRRTEHFTEILEFTELHGGTGDDENYDLEMMSFLNDEDVLKPGEKDCSLEEVVVQEEVREVGVEIETTAVAKRESTNKGKKSRRKIQVSSDAAALSLVGENGSPGERECGQMTNVAGRTAKKKNVKGVKKRSPQNKARWKEFLKQFDKRDEDFEAESGGEEPVYLIQNNNGERGLCRLDCDEHYSPDGRLPAKLKKPTTEATDEPTMDNEGHSKTSDEGCFSDAPFDDMANLLPLFTPGSQSCVPAVGVLRSRGTIAAVPSPPSLDSLDKITSSPASEELEKLDKETEEDPREETSKEAEGLPPSTKFCPWMEPFLMSDFLADDEDCDPDDNDFTGRDRIKDVSRTLRLLDPCTSATTPINLEKGPQVAMSSSGNTKCKDLTFQARFTPNASEISLCHASPVKEETHDARESSKKADSLSDFGAGVWWGSPPINDRGDNDALFSVEDPSFSQVVFMDEMDDDDFPNLTVLGEESGGNRLKTDETFCCDDKSVHNEMLTVESLEEIRCNIIKPDLNTHNDDRIVHRVSSTKLLESAAGIDLTKSVSKLRSFAHNSKKEGVIDDRSKEVENETTRNGIDVDVWSDCHRANNPVRTRTQGERTKTDVPMDTFIVSKTDKHSEFIAPTSAGIPTGSNVGEISLKTGHTLDNSFLSHPACIESDDKRPGLSQATDKTDEDVNETTRVVDDTCRSPHPKKLKLSLKRSSLKDKSVATVGNCEKPTNCRRPLNIESSPQHSSILVGSKSVLGNKGDETGSGPLPSATSEGKNSGDDVHKTPPKVPSVQHEECLSNTSKFRTKDGNIVAVMESDSDNDDDEDIIRPVGKGSTLRRRAFSSPSSQDFKRPAIPGEGRQQAGDRGSHCQRLHSSGSDEEFEHSKQVDRSLKVVEVKRKAQKRKSLEIGAKRDTWKTVKRRHNKVRTHEFLDDEAEQSGSDIGDFSSDEDEEEEDDGEMDSFIDDSSQLTQRTPARLKSYAGNSPVDMLSVYRQSLMSPLCGALNFKTPLFHKQRNRYKMVYNACDQNSNDDSEEEEAYECDSFIDDNVQGEDDYDINESGNENTLDQSGLRGHTHAQLKCDRSFEESQIGRPINRMKRKRILDDSVDEDVSPNSSKQRHVLGQCNNEGIIGKNATCVLTSSKMNNLPKNSFFGNFPSQARTVGTPFQTDFVKSSDILAANKQHQVNRRTADSDTDLSMRRYETCDGDWVGGVSDSELLVALQDGETTSPERPSVRTCLQTKDTTDVRELEEIAAAFEMEDSDVSIEISEIPTFSLHFDFLLECADVSTYEKSENSEPARMDQVSISDDRGISCAVEVHMGVREDNNLNSKTSVSKSERFGMANAGYGEGKINGSFTKITQCSNEGGLKFVHPPENCSTLLQENFQSNFKKPSNTTVLPQRVQNTNIPTESTLNSRLGSLLSLDKGTLQHTGQRTHGVGNAHKPQQIVTPSCRTNSFGTTPMLSPLLTSSLKDKGKTVILVDSREISSSQVVSSLRLKHNIKAEVCQLNGCDYIVSNRMAVKRKTVSDVCNGAHSQKLVDCMRLMCDLYDRPCLIIEKDRVKPGETERNCLKTKAYLFSLACVAQTHVKLVFSESQDETARLLTDLAAMEAKKGMAITSPTSMSKTSEQVFRVLLSFPRVSYITALNLCFSFKSLEEIMNSSPVDLQKRCSCLSSSRAAEIHKHIRHQFNPNMVATKK